MRGPSKRELRRLLAAATKAEADLVRELARLNRLELALVVVHVEPRNGSTIKRQRVVWRSSFHRIAMQAERALGQSVSLFAPTEDVGDAFVLGGDEPGAGPFFNLYAMTRR